MDERAKQETFSVGAGLPAIRIAAKAAPTIKEIRVYSRLSYTLTPITDGP
jgi:hypothetical protein